MLHRFFSHLFLLSMLVWGIIREMVGFFISKMRTKSEKLTTIIITIEFEGKALRKFLKKPDSDWCFY